MILRHIAVGVLSGGVAAIFTFIETGSWGCALTAYSIIACLGVIASCVHVIINEKE